MDIRGEVGDVAGKIWRLLDSNGPHTLAEIKKKLNVSSEILSFAVGWLAREDKVNIVRETRNLRIQLK